MSPARPRYALDSNVFIDAFREQTWNEQLQVFHAAFAPFEASCRESDVTLITRNVEDFQRLSRVIPFRFVQPWPAV